MAKATRRQKLQCTVASNMALNPRSILKPVEMPLTRHLYRDDEVAAALMLSVLKGRVEAAAFWALELLDSGMVEVLQLGLGTVWFYGFGVKALRWIVEFEAAVGGDTVDAMECLRLVNALAILGARGKTDGTMVALAALRPAELERLWPYEFTAARNPLEKYIAGACEQRKLCSAWLAWRKGGQRAELLAEILEWRHGPRAAEWLPAISSGCQQRAGIALAAATISKEDFKVSLFGDLPVLSEGLVANIKEWSAATGRPRMRRRGFPIPVDCLYHITQRGREQTVYDSNEKEIRGSLEKPGALWGSEYWDDVAEEYGGWAAISLRGGADTPEDPEARCSFYADHFPEDIPDEWSTADRALSHGGGVLQRGQSSSVAVWFKRWFGGIQSSLIWRGVEKAIATMESEGGTVTSSWTKEDWGAQTSEEEILVGATVPPPVRRKVVAVA